MVKLRKSSLLDPQLHERIIADFERVCAIGGIQGHFLSESMAKVCGEDECAWVKKFWAHKKDGHPGLLLQGIARPDSRCQAMAAALIRNYVDARVIPLNTLIETMQNGGPPKPTVLFVPNLFMTALSKNMPPWRVQMMYDLLLDRSTNNRPSVVYIDDPKSLVKTYGEPFRDFLSRFQIITDPI
jgi:hypothetical protein